MVKYLIPNLVMLLYGLWRLFLALGVPTLLAMTPVLFLEMMPMRLFLITFTFTFVLSIVWVKSFVDHDVQG